MLPPKRIRPHSGIERAPRREWPRHRKFVRSHACSVPGCADGPIVFAHIRTAENAGTGIKPADWHGVSLCDGHHQESHRGEKTFQRKYRIDLKAIAREFANKSPDEAMKEAMRSLGSEAA